MQSRNGTIGRACGGDATKAGAARRGGGSRGRADGGSIPLEFSLLLRQ